MELGNRIRELRKENYWTQEDLAKRLHVAKVTVSQYENATRFPNPEIQYKLSEIFDVTLDYLNGKSDTRNEKEKNYMTVNIYGTVPAGIPIEAIEDITGTEDLSLKNYSPNKEYIGLKVKGDSMYPKYLEGDTIIIEVTTDFFSGQDCVVYVNGYDATLKSVIKNENGTITLKPINPAYPPRTYTENDDPIKILGIVKEIRRKV